jgi:hypothetical protein
VLSAIPNASKEKRHLSYCINLKVKINSLNNLPSLLLTYIGLVARIYPLLLLYYLFYLLVIDFVYWHTDLTIKADEFIKDDECQREFVDYRLTQILIYFIVSANLLILSKLPTKFINTIFFTKNLTSIGIDFINVLNFYSAFYLLFGFALVLLLAFIKSTLYVSYVISFHYVMLFLIPIYLIYQAFKKAKDSV